MRGPKYFLGATALRSGGGSVSITENSVTGNYNQTQGYDFTAKELISNANPKWYAQ
jgi:hypothetical protein